ncbi:MAG: precorrin-4 C(11)-methyltransferase [Rhodobacteraceae bacterium]|nr:precorrin-4 C(11)-methyltransferase [Paracoccaceae bacterium]
MAGGLVIVAGFGFRTAATIESLVDALEMVGGMRRVSALATARDKAQTEVFAAFAQMLALPVHSVDVMILARQGTATRSAASLAVRGTGSLAEASALAAAGPGARLFAPRVVSGDRLATCALAEGGKKMTVHFIGAGPGAPDLLTLRGRDLIMRCPVCLYAGSLVPKAVLAHCPRGARIVDTAPLDLDTIVSEFVKATAASQDVARLHSGDLSVWSAMGEQMRRLDAMGIPYTVTPGVPSFAAGAAALGAELTLPGVAQSVVLTRTPGRASSMPKGETLAAFGATGATLAIHLSIRNLAQVTADLIPHYGPDCPVAIIWRASWPDERIVRGTLSTIGDMLPDGIERTALILVGPALGQTAFAESRLYAPDYDRRYRPQSSSSPWRNWNEGDG